MSEQTIEDPTASLKEMAGVSGAELLRGEFTGGVNRMLEQESTLNRAARQRLNQSAVTLREMGYGLALSPLTLIGATLGRLAGSSFGPLGGLAGGLIGRAAGAGAGGLVYENVIRRIDPNVRPLAKEDWLIGAVVVNPVVVRGTRDVLDGFRELGQNPSALSLPTTIK